MKTFAFPFGKYTSFPKFWIPSLKLTVQNSSPLQILVFSKFGISKLPGGKPSIFRSPSFLSSFQESSCDKQTNRWTPAVLGPPDTFPSNLESCQVGMEFRRCEDQALVMKDGDLVMTLDMLDSYAPENQDSNSG